MKKYDFYNFRIDWICGYQIELNGYSKNSAS